MWHQVEHVIPGQVRSAHGCTEGVASCVLDTSFQAGRKDSEETGGEEGLLGGATLGGALSTNV